MCMNVTQYPAMLRKTPVWKLINLGQFEEVGVSQTMVASLPNGLVRKARKGHFRGGTNPGVLTDQKKLTPLSFSVTDPAFVGVPLQCNGRGYQNNALHSIFSNNIFSNRILHKAHFHCCILFSILLSFVLQRSILLSSIAKQSSILFSSIAYQGSIFFWWESIIKKGCEF